MARRKKTRDKPRPGDRYLLDANEKPRNAFARSWLAFNFALDGLLGIKPGDLRRTHNKGFKPEATKEFLRTLRFEDTEGRAAPL